MKARNYDTHRSSCQGKTYDLNVGSADSGWYSDGTSLKVKSVYFNPSFDADCYQGANVYVHHDYCYSAYTQADNAIEATFPVVIEDEGMNVIGGKMAGVQTAAIGVGTRIVGTGSPLLTGGQVALYAMDVIIGCPLYAATEGYKGIVVKDGGEGAEKVRNEALQQETR